MTDIDDYFEELNAPMQAVAKGLRSFIEQEQPSLTCKLAWGFACWSGHERIVSVIAHTSHCNFQLWYGAEISARWPNRIEGSGKALRHVKVRSLSEIDDTLLDILNASVELDRLNPSRVR